jgi:hypothetical protein
MGLAQRRIFAEYREKEFPKWKAQLDAAAGFDVPLDVKWDTIPSDDYEDRAQYFQWLDQVYFRPLLTVIKNICIDDMGRTALREHLKKVTIDGSDGHGSHHTTFENGHLFIRHKVYTNVDQEKERVDGWQKMIEQKL